MKLHFPAFTIKPVFKPKRESKSTNNNISRKCYAVVKEIDGELKAIINIDSADQLVLPFTEQSLELKGKEYVFLKEKDKYNHYVCIIRDNVTANMSPGLSTQYNTIHENLLLAGHIIRKNGKMYFNYEDLVKHHYLSESFINEVRIDDNKPLFNK